MAMLVSPRLSPAPFQPAWNETLNDILNKCSSAHLISSNACLEQCKNEFEKAVNALDWNCEADMLSAMNRFYEDLHKIITPIPSLSDELKNRLLAELLKAFKEKWVSHLAESFYSIFSYGNMHTQALAAERFAKRLLKEAPIFTQKGIYHDPSIMELTSEVEKAFYSYSLDQHERRMDSILIDKDKIKQWMRDISRKKAELENTDFSIEQKAMIATCRIVGHVYTEIFHEINNRSEILRNCIWKEYRILKDEMKGARSFANL